MTPKERATRLAQLRAQGPLGAWAAAEIAELDTAVQVTLPELERQFSDLKAYVDARLPSSGKRRLHLLPRSQKDTG
jgi:hypothetical protein